MNHTVVCSKVPIITEHYDLWNFEPVLQAAANGNNLKETQVRSHSKMFLDVWQEYNDSQLEFRDKRRKQGWYERLSGWNSHEEYVNPDQINNEFQPMCHPSDGSKDEGHRHWAFWRRNWEYAWAGQVCSHDNVAIIFVLISFSIFHFAEQRRDSSPKE